MATHITLDQAKAHCRVDFTDDDIYISDLINMAEEYVIDDLQGQAYPTQPGTVTTAGSTALVGVGTTFTNFAVNDVIVVDGEYSRIISAITDDTNLTVDSNFTTTAATKDYNVFTGLPALKSDGTMPLRIKQAMLIMVAHFYNIREPVVVGVALAEVPKSYDHLISKYKTWTVT